MSNENIMTTEDFYLAYRKLKSMAYFDNGGLELKSAIAEFEWNLYRKASKDESFKDIFIKYITPLYQELTRGRISLKKGRISELMSSIDYILTPKKFKSHQNSETEAEGARLITNDDFSTENFIEKYNVLIQAPVEIYILSVLWLMKVAVRFEHDIPANNYANRFSCIEDTVSEDRTDGIISSGLMLFRPYFKGYQDWRDKGLSKAISLLDDSQDCALVSLDIKRYFYSVRMNVLQELGEYIKNDRTGLRLTKILQEVHKKYAECTGTIPLLKLKQENLEKEEFSLPVGLPSSGWLANWYLVEFDSKILVNAEPEYYGRYVDDLIFVFRCNSLKGNDDKERIYNFIKKHFIDTDILEYEGNSYWINVNDTRLEIQNKKVVLEYFRHDASRAAINKFKKNVDRNRSEFRYLPFNNLVDVEFDDKAFSVEYSDSVNKLRSLKNMSENKFGASTYLAHKIFLALSSTETGKQERKDNALSAKQILSFFSGKIALDMYQLWEKVATYFLLTSDYHNMKKFYNQAYSAIESIQVDGNEQVEPDKKKTDTKQVLQIKQTLNSHLNLSFAMAFALCPSKIDRKTDILEGASDREEGIRSLDVILRKARRIRKSYLFRQNYIRIPGICYTSYNDGESDLTQFTYEKLRRLKINSAAGELSPVFLHFHDLNLLEVLANTDNPRNCPKDILNKTHRYFYEFNYRWQGLKEPDKFFNVIPDGNNYLIDVSDTADSTSQPQPTQPNKLIGIVNWFVDPKDCEAALRQGFVLKKKHQEKLFEILNYANRHKVELIALPELAVPIQQLPLLVRQCCRQDMAAVSGLNYVVFGKSAYNYTVTILPVRTKYYTTCVIIPRLKNYPAPSETHIVNGFYLAPRPPRIPYYNLFHWRKAYFSVYNCFELSNITDRALFKSKVDFIIASEYNRDTNYYSNVIESWARDLHCYIMQINTSDFGDSRVVRPTTTAQQNIMSVSGGAEPLLLIDTLGIDAIRDFQEHAYCWQIDPDGGKSHFKPTPPMFEYQNTQCRRRNLPLTSKEWKHKNN